MKITKFNYQPLFDGLEEKGISRRELCNKYYIPASQLTRMKKGENTSIDTIGRMMEVLGTDDPRNVVKISIVTE